MWEISSSISDLLRRAAARDLERALVERDDERRVEALLGERDGADRLVGACRLLGEQLGTSPTAGRSRRPA
jgi:hypothetical protein